MTWRLLGIVTLLTQIASATTAKADGAPAGGPGVETGLGLATSFVSFRPNPSTVREPGAALSVGGYWHFPLHANSEQAVLIGPRLGSALQLTGATYPFFVDLDASFAWHFQRRALLGAYLAAGIGPSFNAARRVRSFDIDHKVRSAFGVHAYLGYGLCYPKPRRRWTLETRVEVREGYSHRVTMADRRTGEEARGSERNSAVTMMVYAGVAF